MPVDDPTVVDAIGVDKVTGEAILTICDAWDWEDEHLHLVTLQDKVNSYLEFIEGGQIWEEYPRATGRQLVIEVITRFELPPIAMQFFEVANRTTAQLNVIVRHRWWPGTTSDE